MNTFISGFLLSLSFILAIGAQNAFVLRQGILREFIFTVCFICALSDAILISLGVFFISEIEKALPKLAIFMRYGGGVFLFFYAFLRLKSAFLLNNGLIVSFKEKRTYLKIVLTTIAITWLNPHVYLDTVLLLGTAAQSFKPNQLSFALGAMSASMIFFFALGYGASFFSAYLKKPKIWKIIEFFIGIFMLYLGIKLVSS